MTKSNSNIRQAVIMAAGLGTRLRPFTLETPKPMLCIAGRPILEWTIERLPAEIDRVVIVVNYRKERIIEHFGTAWHGRKMSYVEQRELKGTGDALHACRAYLDEKFLVLNGDDLYSTTDIVTAASHELAILAKEINVPGRFGAFRTDERGNMIDIIEGAEIDKGGLVNAGLYVLDRRFFDYPLVPIKNGAEFGLPQTLALMAKDIPIAIIKATFWMPIGYPEDLDKATAALTNMFNAQT